ncbi:MAG: ABC transporter permease [Tepidisphaeraceae bacterium]
MNGRKTRIIASREYSAAVRSKSFLITLVLLPVMMSGGLIAQKVGQKIGDTSTYHVAVMDCSTRASLYGTIAEAVRRHNEHRIFDDSGRQVRGKFVLEPVAPVDWRDPAALDRARLSLSDRVRAGQLLAFVEIGPAVLSPGKSGGGDAATIRYSTNRPTYPDFLSLLQSALPSAVIQKRIANAGVEYQKLQSLLWPPAVVECGLAESSRGKIKYQSQSGQLVNVAVPIVMIMLIFIVTLMGTSPIAGNVVEEKQLRIAEVLLGSVTPFELMIGKLVGGVAVSLTLAAIFFGGAYYLAYSFGMSGYVSWQSIGWFFFFTIVGTFMYGSLFAAAGAACSNVKEVQSFIMPVMLFIALPMFVLGPVLQNPSGAVGMALSFFPLSAPTVMVMRLTIPPGVPAWQPIVAAASALAATVGFVWAAGRIFRVGILMQGKGANYAAVLRWILRG